MGAKDISEIDKCLEQAYSKVIKLESDNDDYSSLVEKEYENCNLFFLKMYLEMFKSEVNVDCLKMQLENLRMYLVYAQRVFKEYGVMQK